jgi:hypothetical protein
MVKRLTFDLTGVREAYSDGVCYIGFVPMTAYVDGKRVYHRYTAKDLCGLWDEDYTQVAGTCQWQMRRSTLEKTLRAIKYNIKKSLMFDGLI